MPLPIYCTIRETETREAKKRGYRLAHTLHPLAPKDLNQCWKKSLLIYHYNVIRYGWLAARWGV
jgi:hypothetical protein